MAALDTGVAVAVVGAGTMGAGIAQVAAQAGHRVLLYDAQAGAVERAVGNIERLLQRGVEKGRLTESERDRTLRRLVAAGSMGDLAGAGLAIEAVVEDLEVKRSIFGELQSLLPDDAILASNTSSLSITAIAAGLDRPERLVGMHFFNPAPLMALVEIVSGLATDPAVAETAFDTAAAWGKSPVHARSTPGFIVNRVARPFYGEALRLIEEEAADPATVDAVMREAGGFRMGPFQLMDLIGLDVNYAVTCSVFEAYYQDPRFRPSLRQLELVEAGRFGRKTGRGWYDYAEGADPAEPATAEPAPAPGRVVVTGDLGPAAALADRIAAAGIEVAREAGRPGLVVADRAVLRLTDGRTATERAAAADGEPLVLFDLALDYGAAERIAIAGGDGTPPAAVTAAAGLFQALGKAVSVIDDVPGLIVARTVAMLANEAADAVNQGVADAAGVDTAMRRGVNYPKGPLEWADALGPDRVLTILDNLARVYGEDRYRASPLLRRKVAGGGRFRD